MELVGRKQLQTHQAITHHQTVLLDTERQIGAVGAIRQLVEHHAVGMQFDEGWHGEKIG
jgi:hypothetical protein